MACASLVVRIKAGAAFKFAAAFTDLVTDLPEDLTGYTLASHVDQAGVLVEALTITWLDASVGAFEVYSADTTAWPLDRLDWDIKLTTPGGDDIFTDTFTIIVGASVTTP